MLQLHYNQFPIVGIRARDAVVVVGEKASVGGQDLLGDAHVMKSIDEVVKLGFPRKVLLVDDNL